MSHPFGDLVSQHLHRKHGLSQARLAAGIQQDPSVITEMCKGRRLTGPQSRERVIAIVNWLHEHGALDTQLEAGALLSAAGLAPLNTPELVGMKWRAALADDVSSPTSRLTLKPAPAPPQMSNLPHPATPFVGRERELADILSRLRDPACRLLTVLGPGGVGKSRVAIETARRLTQDESALSAYFVQLARVDSPDGVPGAIARALQFNFYKEVPVVGAVAPAQQPQQPAHQQMLDYLRDKHVLLILDNAEQVSAGAKMYADLLAAAPQLQLLVTSRESLNLQEEWLFALEGMALTANDAAETDSDAMQLFVQCAQRVRPDFGSTQDKAGAQHICELVEGMPLGIELAASWVRTLPVEAIAQEIERGVDILTSRLQNTPERHHSLRRVFEHSWQRLSESEQQVLMRLAVLHGFSLEAAQTVGAATLPILAALVDKSFLRVTASGRYQMHGLLRQWVEEKLRDDEIAHADTLTRHSTYYLGFVAAREDRLSGAGHVQALEELDQESDNVRAAWMYAVQRGDLAAMTASLKALHLYFESRSHFAAGENLLAQAAQTLSAANTAHELLLARILSRQASFALFMGRHADAQNFLTQTIETFRRFNLPVEVAFALNSLGHFAVSKGEIKESIQFFEQSLEMSRMVGDETSEAQTLNQLGWVHGYALGDAQTDLHYQQQSLALCRKHHLQRRMAYVLEDIGTCHLKLGNTAEAAHSYEACLRTFRQLGDAYGIAKALNGLASSITDADRAQWQTAAPYRMESIALLREIGHRRQLAVHLVMLGLELLNAGQHERAYPHVLESFEISSELGDPVLQAFGHINLAQVALCRKDFEKARHHLRQALRDLSRVNADGYIQWCIVRWAQILLAEAADDDLKCREHVLALLYLALGHTPDFDTLTDGQPMVTRLEAELPADSLLAAKTHSEGMNLQGVVESILQAEP